MALPEELRDGKVGRFPIWGIGIALAAVFILIMFLRNRKKGSTSSGPAAEPLDAMAFPQDEVSGLPPGAIGDYLGGNPMDPAYPVGLTPQGIPGPITNVQWTRLAFDYLIGLGNDPALTEKSLQKYIQGQQLSAQERAIVNLAQRAFGAPPEGLILVPEGDIPGPPQPGTGPIKEHVYAGQPADAWINAMTAKYGVYWGQLVAMNPGIAANVSLNTNPAARKFIRDADYVVKT